MNVTYEIKKDGSVVFSFGAVHFQASLESLRGVYVSREDRSGSIASMLVRHIEADVGRQVLEHINNILGPPPPSESGR